MLSEVHSFWKDRYSMYPTNYNNNANNDFKGGYQVITTIIRN